MLREENSCRDEDRKREDQGGVRKCNLAAVRNREGCRGQTKCEALRRGGGPSITLGADLAAVSGYA